MIPSSFTLEELDIVYYDSYEEADKALTNGEYIEDVYIGDDERHVWMDAKEADRIEAYLENYY